MKEVNRTVADEVDKVHHLIVRNLAYIGEYAVTLARDEHAKNYKDQTGNLRASVGYVIARDGSPIQEYGFDADAAKSTQKEKDGDTGAMQGKNLAIVLAKQTSGFTLVIVAGMQYGIYVEKKQYDVLTFTEANARILANDLFRKMFGTTI